MKRPKFEFTQNQYIHHGMMEANRGRTESLQKIEATVVSMMVSAYMAEDEVRAAALRDVVRRINQQKAEIQENDEYLRKVDARING